MPVLDTDGLISERIDAIREYHRLAGTNRAQLDVSGGVDSAVMLALLSWALGQDNVTAVYTGIHSSEDSLTRARELCAGVQITLEELEMSDVFEEIVQRCSRQFAPAHTEEIKRDPTVLGSLRSTLRAPIGRFMNRLAGGGIRHGTSNECEDRWLRFYQKGGDGEVDTNPIGFLSKGEVYQLAVALEVPSSILHAKPSPDLHANGDQHSDEDELRSIWGFPWTLSKVNDDGQYKSVGTIELMSRMLDMRYTGTDVIGNGQLDEVLFLRRPVSNAMINWTADILGGPLYKHLPYSLACLDRRELAQTMLRTCQTAEAVTRHKANPNIPQLGNRYKLRELKLITDVLP